MNDFTHHLQQDSRRLENDLQALLEDTEDLLRHAVQDAGEGYAQARRRLEQRVKAAREQLAAAQRAGRAAAAEGAQATVRYVKTHPWQAVGIGIAVGAIVTALLRRHHD